MKKVIALILVLMMVLSLAACGEKDDNKDDGKNVVSNLTDEQLVEKLAGIMDGKTGDLMVENISFAELADMGVETSGLFGNWFNGMAVPEGAKVAVNQAMMMGQAHVVLLIQPAEGTDINKLEQDLKANANPRWNVCTEADSVGSAVKDGLIIFVMTTSSLTTAEAIIADFNK